MSETKKGGVQMVTVGAGDDGVRLDRWFKQHYPGLTHGRLEKLLRTGQIRVDGGRVKASRRLALGEDIRVPPLSAEAEPPKPRTAPRLKPGDAAFVQGLVIHRDKSVLVLNKPSGLPVQGGTKTERHLDAMLDALQFEAEERPRLVHRLDRDTSGVLVLARTRQAARALTRAFRERETRKVYWALSTGVPTPQRGTITAALAKTSVGGGDGAARERVTPVWGRAEEEAADAKRAITHYAVIAHAGRRAAWLAMMPVTGRTHQIRAHAGVLGTPIAGDGKYGYGKDRPKLGQVPDRLHLHARSLSIAHPERGILTVSAPLPPHMLETWALFGFDPHTDEDPFEDLDA